MMFEKSLMDDFNGIYPGYIIANTLRRFGEGTKVAVEIVMEASDASLVPEDAEVIAIDQDPLGKQGNRVARTGSTDVWQKPLSGGNIAVALLNRGEKPAEITVQWKDLKAEPSAVFAARDLWAHKDLGKFTDHLTLTVEPHATVLIKLQPLVQQAKN